ncbi:hypothetical protein [uncultured Lamprocystis sp.]|nr:hypothetical protein [uncultured Lamprocystis sp.]
MIAGEITGFALDHEGKPGYNLMLFMSGIAARWTELIRPAPG